MSALRGRFNIERGEFAALEAGRGGDPFRVLVATIISQNTNERNALLAFKKLEEEVGVEPAKIASGGVAKVEEAIKVAGLQRQKAGAIVAAAELLLRSYGGDLGGLLREGEGRVREVLGSVKGIGEKTIDVLLAFSGFPVVPVDTHVRRVSRRLGLARGSSYYAVREALHRVFREGSRLEAHLLLIKLGREICRARDPRCDACPLARMCPSAFQASTR